jgi:phenylacetyl-CoA:acceptor oxidoreductase subunit 1
MVADLERCVGCQTCTAACKHANATSPAVQWRRVLDVESGSFPNVRRTFIPVGCQHCDDPPCMHVCPSGATQRRADGIVIVDYDTCIGCAYCDVACPYQARFLVGREDFAFQGAPLLSEVERDDPGRVGVAQKCDFCSGRIDFGLGHGLVPGVDAEATPACVNACIASALHFGDLDDPQSNVSELLRQENHFRMHEELATQPGFYYVGRADHPAAGDGAPAHARTLRHKGVEPAHQQHWDWKAAANFICGGAGTSLYVCAAVVGGPALRPVGSAALALVALGLFLLLFKIGRPHRFLYVLLQPRRSWMAREAWVAGAFFPLAASAIALEARPIAGAAGVVALLFLLCQAMILKEAKGIPAWREWRVVPLIATTGLAEGVGLFLLAAAFDPALRPPLQVAALIAAALAALRAQIWHHYVAALRAQGAPAASLEVLTAFTPTLHLAGLALPLAATAAAFLFPRAAPALFALGGCSSALAGAALKFVLVTRAGFNQGFALGAAGQHGIAAQAPVRPGWSPPSRQGSLLHGLTALARGQHARWRHRGNGA